MKAVNVRLLALSSIFVLGACADQIPGTSGPSVEISVAPLNLPGASDVCYGIYIQNGSGQLVEALTNICSTQYGNDEGGDITYIAPCDASDGNALHKVTLVLEGFKTGGTAWADETQYQNPCGWNRANPLAGTNPPTIPSDTTSPTPKGNDNNANFDGSICQRTFTCQENEDVLVPFDITVMRDADQGFFDIAVNFEDIFCSSKFDTCYDGGVPIELLFGDDSDTDTINTGGDLLGDEPGRDRTGVFGLACTAGAQLGVKTDILMSRVRVQCPANTTTTPATNATTFFLPISGNPNATGNQKVSVNWGTVTTDVEYALYIGGEELDCGTMPFRDEDGYAYGDNAEYRANWDDTLATPAWVLTASATDASVAATATGGTATTPPTSFTITDGGQVVLPYHNCQKSYLNLAINLEDLPPGCTLSLQATAQDDNDPAFTGGSVTTMATSGTMYPFVTVTNANLDADSCVQHGLNDGGSVSTFYGSNLIGGRQPHVMCDHSLAGGAPAAITQTATTHATQATARPQQTKADLTRIADFARLKDPCTFTTREVQGSYWQKLDLGTYAAEKPTTNSFQFTSLDTPANSALLTALNSADATFTLGAELSDTSEIIGTYKGTDIADAMRNKTVMSNAGLVNAAALYWGVRITSDQSLRSFSRNDAVMMFPHGFELNIGINWNYTPPGT